MSEHPVDARIGHEDAGHEAPAGWDQTPRLWLRRRCESSLRRATPAAEPQLPRRPRSARLAISALTPNVQGGAARDVVTVLTSAPSLGEATVTTSPCRWVNPCPAPSR